MGVRFGVRAHQPSRCPGVLRRIELLDREGMHRSRPADRRLISAMVLSLCDGPPVWARLSSPFDRGEGKSVSGA